MIEFFEWFAFVGIVLEIAGFILLLKYYGRPFPRREYDRWKARKFKEGEEPKNVVTKSFEFEEGGTIIHWQNQPIDKGFYYRWLLKTKGPILLVIAGLSFQLIQLFD